MKFYNSLSDRLKTQHEAIETIISVVNEERLYIRPQQGKWNIHDNVAHLAKYQPVFIDRINTILSKDNPFFERYKAENDPKFETWRGWDTKDLVRRLKIHRPIIFQLIIGLSEPELSRVGIHAKFGKLTLLQWAEFFLLHKSHHIFTIFQLANDRELTD